MSTLSPQTPIGKYVIQKLIAEGGMGEVYLARAIGPAGFEKDVVIKRIRSFLARDQEFVKMFVAEARLASRLNHPNIVQIFDFDQHEDTYYIAMEYVPGHSIIEVQRRRREHSLTLSPVMIAHIGAEVARGLHYAHTKTDRGEALHLVHRDCTPHNVLLSFDGAVKLTDFGIAKANDKSTAPGVLKGKYAYMSPEQGRGEEVDARTDIFALGVVLWELLTGARLFEGDSELAVLRAVQQSYIAPPSRLHPHVPEELSAIVMKALERDAAARYQTAEELDWDLTAFVAKQPDSRTQRDVRAFMRRVYAEESHAWGAVKEEPAIQEANGYEVMPSMVLSPDEDPHAATVPRIAGGPPQDRTGTPVQRGTSTPPTPEDPASERTRQERAPRPAEVASTEAPNTRVVAGLLAGVIAIGAVGGIVFWNQRNHQTAKPMDATVQPIVTPPPVQPAPASPAEVPPPTPTASKHEDSIPPPAPAAAATSPAPAPAATSNVENSSKEGSGYIVTTIKPWAYVFIDDKPHGFSGGVKKFKVPAGTHRLRFVNAGHVKETVVQVEDGETVEQSYNVRP